MRKQLWAKYPVKYRHRAVRLTEANRRNVNKRTKVLISRLATGKSVLYHVLHWPIDYRLSIDAIFATVGRKRMIDRYSGKFAIGG